MGVHTIHVLHKFLKINLNVQFMFLSHLREHQTYDFSVKNATTLHACQATKETQKK